MEKFTISWYMGYEERSYDEKLRCSFWKLELNAEWMIKCISEQNKLRNPAFIEVRRKSTGSECLISGVFEIHDEKQQQQLMQKKFVYLIEKGNSFSRIDLQYRSDAVKIHPSKLIFVTGEVIISTRTETSLNLTELVHLTSSDCSSLRLLSINMEELFEKPLFTDVTLKCGCITFPVHKSILSARSPVFKAMFNCPLKEAIENEVIISDIEPSIMKALLKYIYTGKIDPMLPVFTSDLLFAANMYQIKCLESACSNYLMSNISMKNALSILVIGDYVSPDMKNIAIDFICNKCTDYSALEQKSDWIALKNKNPTLALEILSSIVKHQEGKLKKRT